MNEQLERKLKNLPEEPGIYKMLDRKGNIIYIGKSKCLKKRVHSYFVPSPVWDKAREMARFIEDIELVVTDTHLEAMLLECDSIKKIKPPFNSMMKNDGRYAYLTLEENYRRNPLKITGIREELSFGPFRRKGPLQDVIDAMRNLYPISRKNGWYQFDYHVFPDSMSHEIFMDNRELLKGLLSSRTAMNRFLYAIEREMKNAAAEQRFERASGYRDLHMRLTWLQKYLARFEEWRVQDVIYAVPLRKGYKLFYISDGRVVAWEKTTENTPDIRSRLVERAKLEKENLPQDKTEKELLDYKDIVYAELSGGDGDIYPVDDVM